jgi:hypothetical protein
MTTYYVDPAATGLQDGSSWANAWTSLQEAIDGGMSMSPPADGDLVLMRGEETPSATIDWDSTGGSTTGGVVTYRGVNASGVDDGTRYKINGDSSRNTINWLTSWTTVENLEINGGNNGFYKQNYSMKYYCNFLNIYIHNCNADGVYQGTGGSSSFRWTRCRFEDNGGDGMEGGAGVVYQCVFKGNSGYGVKMIGGQYGIVLIDSLILNNDVGIWLSHYTYSFSYILGCVVDGNASTGIVLGPSGIQSVYSTRITANGGAGISVSGTAGHVICRCVMPGSGQDRENGAANVLVNATLIECDFAITDTDAGYVDSSAGNFQLAATATNRNVGFSAGSNTTLYSTTGLTPEAAAAAASSSVATGTQIYPFRHLVEGDFKDDPDMIPHPLYGN